MIHAVKANTEHDIHNQEIRQTNKMMTNILTMKTKSYSTIPTSNKQGGQYPLYIIDPNDT